MIARRYAADRFGSSGCMDGGRAIAAMTLGLLLAACSSNSEPTMQNVLPPAPRASDRIKHVIVVIQENRSLENLFAGYPGANAPMSGCAIAEGGGRLSPSSGCPRGDVSVPLQRTTFERNPGLLPHDWSSSLIDWHRGRMDGFYKSAPHSGLYAAYTYIDRMQVRPYWTMAKQYVLADE
ncbi:MAG: hypothetical protein JO146_07910, partial [Candidatus Eremiobacteraeota bacterium]|nr:hypothetical protein [Candidatus Eremiobacteraeota bacterium]